MTNRTCWQIAGGPTDRAYADDFLKYSVALIGPGDPGPWKIERDDGDFEGGSVRWFASEVALGDLFVLRIGNAKAVAVGSVASEYLHLPQFDDVNGWPLQHARRVRWFRLPAPHDFGRAAFGANPQRFARVWAREIVSFAERFIASPPTDWQSALLPDLPPEEGRLSVVPEAFVNLVALAHDLGLQAYWDRQNFGEHPSESEMVAHFVVPFFRALGWRPELIAVGWQRTDVALFRALPRIAENCQVIVEAKCLGAGVEGAVEQAQGYADTLGSTCDLVVTDGLRYRLYAHDRGYAPVAYANLGRLKESSSRLFERLKKT
ncbi:MAG TPA: hypothetical protein VND64_35370 [Pirellulales bacterium]|nr:hypothetical protein [Pirellulales bacterium]